MEFQGGGRLLIVTYLLQLAVTQSQSTSRKKGKGGKNDQKKKPVSKTKTKGGGHEGVNASYQGAPANAMIDCDRKGKEKIIHETVTDFSSKKRKISSNVWTYFKREVENRTTWAICQYCNKRLQGAGSYGTTHLWRHVEGKCPKFKVKRDKNPEGDIMQKILKMGTRGDGSKEMQVWKFDQERSRREMAEAIILHEYPFSFVEHAGLRRWIINLQPQFVMISRRTITKDCYKIFENKKKILFDLLEKIDGRINFTSDIWTSSQNIAYIALTCHFIDQDWKLQKRVLNFSKVESRHTGEWIAKCLIDKILLGNKPLAPQGVV